MANSSYYAHWNFSEDVTLKLHIGVLSNKAATLSGTHFPDWRSMKSFLEHNEEKLTIRDSNGDEASVWHVVKAFDSATLEQRGEHHRFLSLATDLYGETVVDEASPRTGTCWLDADGYSFYNGYFN